MAEPNPQVDVDLNTGDQIAPEPTKGPATDLSGKPIKMPEWWPGSLDEFVSEVESLEPHHCAWPDGRRESIDGGMCCRGRKTAMGICREHLPSLLPIMHRDGKSLDEMREVALGLRDPQLAHMGINIVYADKALNRASNRCTAGKVAEATAESTGKLAALCLKDYGIFQDAFNNAAEFRHKARDAEAGGDTRNQRLFERRGGEELKRYEKHLKQLGERLESLREMLNETENENALWRELLEANQHSVDVKHKVADVDIKRREAVSAEEVSRAFMGIAEAVELVVREELESTIAQKVLQRIYMEGMAKRGIFTGTMKAIA